jgi:HemY protein
MRTLAWGLTVLLGAVAVTLLVNADNGYVLIGWGVWTIELSLALALLLLGAAYVALHYLLRLFGAAQAVPKTVQTWSRDRARRRARRSLTRGLLDLAEGDWRSAERSLTRHVAESETPLLNYLSAARAAQLQGADERRDLYLRLAHESMPSAQVAVALTQAELQLAHQQFEQALATLRHLQTLAPKHAYVLKLLHCLYEKLGDWQQLREMLPELRRRVALPESELDALELRVHRELLRAAANSGDPARLAAAWEDTPKTLRATSALAAHYAELLLARGAQGEAEALLREGLRRAFDERLAAMYGQVETADAGRQLSFAEELLGRQPRSAVLLLALGRLALRARLWGKARSYLEASLGVAPSAEAYCELGNLLEQLGEGGAARDCYRKGLAMGVEAAPVLLPEGIAAGTRAGQRLLSAAEHGAPTPSPPAAAPASRAQPRGGESFAYSKASE